MGTDPMWWTQYKKKAIATSSSFENLKPEDSLWHVEKSVVAEKICAQCNSPTII